MEKRELWRHFDYWLFGAVIILCTFGVAMIRSAAAGSQSLVGLPASQMVWIFISLVVIIGTASIDYHYWLSLSRILYIFAVVSLIVIFITGVASFGSARWISTALFNIQPSELAKIIMIIVLAAYFSSQQEKPRDLRWISKGFFLTFFVVVWILLQPNLSTSLVVLVMWFSMMWISGLPNKYLFIMVSLVVVVVALFGGMLASGMKIPFIQDYQLKRIATFVFPDPNARHGDTYNVDQALISIGSGGLTGQGYGHGTQVQLRYLKVRHTDFIFAAMAEEFGFIGTVIVIAMLLFVMYRCFRATRLASDFFGALIAYGFGFLIFFQTAVNIGVNLKVLPVTGLTLPFISYGGSSLLSLAFGIGLVESVILRQNR